MKHKIHLYWQENCKEYIDNIANKLQEMFALQIIYEGIKEPSDASLDSFRKQYDVRYLVKELEAKKFSLWVLSVDISDYKHLYLYGAATKEVAIVSGYRSGFNKNLLKEACHEVGHMLGFLHCKNECVMHTSKNIYQLNKKKPTLCTSCIKKLKVFKELC